jgi:SAM-dependent methyltransferase
MDSNQTHEVVRKAYAAAARKQACCCEKKASSCCEPKPYSVPDHPVPEAELGLSCGNPLAFGHIRPGDVVVDLGSGAGKDVFLAAQKVGPAGRAIGVDMTPEMLTLAARNAEKFAATTGLTNVEFRKGLIEDLPVADGTADLVISNCVINLSPDKNQVFREVHRVLKSGGRMIVSDIVLNRELPVTIRENEQLYSACLAGALLREDYLQAIRDAGFRQVEILSDLRRETKNAIDDPITSGAAEFLADAASSVTVLAVKN